MKKRWDFRELFAISAVKDRARGKCVLSKWFLYYGGLVNPVARNASINRIRNLRLILLRELNYQARGGPRLMLQLNLLPDKDQ